MADKQVNLQDQFLNAVRRAKVPVTVFLVKGVKLNGVITWFDAFSFLLRRDGVAQLLYKHSVSTIMPVGPVDGFAAPVVTVTASRPALQDQFLAAARGQQEPMTIFLVNGVMLQGHVGGHDQFSILLERGEQMQLVYKHAVSTLQPAHNLDLSGEGDDS